MTDYSVHWISVSAWQVDADPIQQHPLAFRFDFSNQESGVEIEITASNSYVLWINGHRAVEGPVRAYPADRFLDRIKADRWLLPGINRIAVLLLPPTGVTGYSCPTRSGLFVQIHTKAGVLGSSRFWKAKSANWISSRNQLLSLPGGYQEHWDYSREPKGWMVGNVESWPSARELGPAGTPPWENLRPRPIRIPEARDSLPDLIWCGVDDRIPASENNPALSFAHGEMVQMPFISRGPIKNDRANVFVFDLGKTRFFRPGVRILEAGSDTALEWYYDTVFKDRPSVMRGFGTEREGNCDTVCGVSREVSWSTLKARGGRFVTLRIAGASLCEVLPDFLMLDYPLPPEKKCPSGIDWLKKAWAISAESLRSCCTDGIVDTCARENVIWCFDACVSGKALYHTFGDKMLWRYCLWLIGCGIDARGIPSSVVPGGPSFMVLFDQAFRWVISCEEYARLTGDDSLEGEVVLPMQRLLEAVEKTMTRDDLFVPPGYSWHWVDWAPIDRRPYSLPVNALLFIAARAAGRFSSKLAEIAQRIVSRLEPALLRFRREDGFYRDHIEAPEGVDPGNDFLATPPEKCPGWSFHGNALMADILSGEAREALCDKLANWLRGKTESVPEFGPGWVQILLQPLVEAGHEDAVLDFLRMRYGAGVDVGVPTWGKGSRLFHRTRHTHGERH